MLEEDNIVTWKFDSECPEDDDIRRRLSGKDTVGGGAADPKAIKFEKHQYNFESFVQALDQGRKPELDGREGRKAVEIILAIYAAAKKGKRVTLQSAK